MKKKNIAISFLLLLVAAGIWYYVSLPAFNIHSSGVWYFVLVLVKGKLLDIFCEFTLFYL